MTGVVNAVPDIMGPLNDLTGEVSGSMDIAFGDVILLCTPGGHWISNFRFKNKRTIRHATKEFGAISFDMMQPKQHKLTHDDIIPAQPTESSSTSVVIGPIGTLEVSMRESKNITSSRSNVHPIIFPIQHGAEVTGRVLLRAIEDEHMHQYSFYSRQDGCLYWQLELLAMLSLRQWVQPDARESALQRIDDVYNKSLKKVKHLFPGWPPKAGIFYRLAGWRASSNSQAEEDWAAKHAEDVD